VSIKKADSYGQYSKMLDIIFVWAGPEATIDMITPLTGIAPKNPAVAGDGASICVVIFTDKASPLFAVGNIENISMIHNEFDLRQIDMILDEKLGMPQEKETALV
jgi:hypothetical protein